MQQISGVAPNLVHRSCAQPLLLDRPDAPGVIDLCSGMGGLSLAAMQLGFRVIAGVDSNETALKTFSKNFPDAKAFSGSVRSSTILSACERLLNQFKSANQPTVVLSGPPCQGFSAAGTRDPLDPRNQILVAVARAVSKLQPVCALIENVSTLITDKHLDRIKAFERVVQAGGFHVAHVVLDASEFGVPQKRRRAFLLVTRQRLDSQELMTTLMNFRTGITSVGRALDGLASPPVRPDNYDDETDYGTVHNHFAMQHSERVKQKIAGIEPGRGPMSYRRLHPERLSKTLFCGHRAPPAHFAEPRSITVREAARLQGFPDSFRVYGSFANQMEQVANAVPPPMTRAVLCVLAELAGIPMLLRD